MSSSEAKVLSSVCTHGDAHVILGEKSEIFGAYGDVYEFIRDYYLKHKSVPGVSLIEEKFGEVDFPESLPAGSAFYMDELRNEYVRGRMEEIMLKAGSALDSAASGEVLQKLMTSLAKLGQHTFSVRDLSLIDIDSAVDHFDKLHEITEANDGSPGIATGFDAIDSAYPTGMAPGHMVVLMGYAQPYSEPVLTDKGWTSMGELSLGDNVIGSNGTPTEVLEIHEQGDREVYVIHFNDGTSVRCDKGHLWNVQTRKMRQNGSGYKTVSVSEMLSGRVKYDGERDTMYKYYLPLPEPVQGNNEVTVGGYLMGQLLSDGCTTGTSVQITTNDEEAIDLIRRESPDRIINEVTTTSSTARQWRVMGGYEGLEHLKGVYSYQKTISEEYFGASVETRYALLKGLMDGDGSVIEGSRATYYTTSPLLAEDVARLVRSLGGVASVRETPRIYKSGNHGYVVTLWTPENPFGISRKAKRYTCKPWFKAIDSIEATGVTERQRCIRVAADDHLYITTDYTVTHNTGRGKSMWSGLLAVNAWLQNRKVMVISLEMSPEEYRERIYAMMSEGQFKMSSLSRGEVDSDDFRSWATKKFENANDFIVVSNQGASKVTPNTIQAKIDTHRPDIVILDYLQLMSDNAETQAMTPRMLNLSRETKLLAVSNGIPIVAITAVTDEDNDRRDAPPLLSQIAWSSGIEYDANIAIAIHRHDETDVVELAGRKNRHGPLFDCFFQVDFDSGVWVERFDS